MKKSLLEVQQLMNKLFTPVKKTGGLLTIEKMKTNDIPQVLPIAIFLWNPQLLKYIPILIQYYRYFFVFTIYNHSKIQILKVLNFVVCNMECTVV